MDSMTLYRGMDIGTAKPSNSDRDRVPHHLVDVLDPCEPASVDWYVNSADRICQDIFARGRRPLLVGGTPLYLKACLRGLFEGPPADATLREKLTSEAEDAGSESLHVRLEDVDPKSAQRIHPRDTRRIIRALEVHQLTGRPLSEYQIQFALPAHPLPPVACLVRPREELYRRIDDRVLRMLGAGWIEEVRRLIGQPRPPTREALQAAGYREIVQFLDGELECEEMVGRIQTRTRQLCKRQLTWFRHLEECSFFETSESEPIESVVRRIGDFLECPNEVNGSEETKPRS